MTYLWINPKNPPKKWWDDCVSGVKKSSSAYDPQSVCGALWYKKMSPTQKRAATRKAEKHPPKKWWDDCVKGVEKSGSKVCGALWYNKMSPTQKRAATRKTERR